MHKMNPTTNGSTKIRASSSGVGGGGGGLLTLRKPDLRHNADRHFYSTLKTNQIKFLPSGLV